MPKSTFPRDRFDDLPEGTGRVGAHRAENPRMRGWVVLLWSVLATVVLVVLGIFATLIAQGRIVLSPQPEQTSAATPLPEASPVVDMSFSVVVLNATTESGLATQVKDVIVGAGWPAESVTSGEAGSTDFPTTTVYYAFPADESAALGLAEVIGGAEVARSDYYANLYMPQDDPDTEGDESQVKLLVVVIGADRVDDAPAS